MRTPDKQMDYVEDLATLATGRTSDLFQEDLGRCWSEIQQSTKDRRVLVLGGAGTIGASTVKILSTLDLACLHVVDQNENALVELVRDLRSSRDGMNVRDFSALPLDFGSRIMLRHLESERPYDLVLNFAALKHVRSEKGICSALQMLETNLLKPLRFWRWLQETGSDAEYFSVSTDKAADPVNLMGASKRIMEHLMFCADGWMPAKRVTSSRFANVAFSNGSLLESFLQRFEKQQPLACPRDTSRFFISIREAGQICILAALCGPDCHIVIPRLDAQSDSHLLSEIASRFLRSKGKEPEIHWNEETARASSGNRYPGNRYPLLLTPLDTEGEKTSETFAGRDEEVVEFGMSRLLAVRYKPPVSLEVLRQFMRDLETFIENPGKTVDKECLVQAVSRVIPEFQHSKSSHILDERM